MRVSGTAEDIPRSRSSESLSVGCTCERDQGWLPDVRRTMPGASLYAMREGLRSVGVDNQTVIVTETLMDSKTLSCVSTAHSSRISTRPGSRGTLR
jgi:hypothetical protein